MKTCRVRKQRGFILIFTLSAMMTLTYLYLICLQDKLPREMFYRTAMKTGGFLEKKKVGNTLNVSVRGLLDVERWSMLEYIKACFYDLMTKKENYHHNSKDFFAAIGAKTGAEKGKADKCLRTAVDFFRFSTGTNYHNSDTNKDLFMAHKAGSSTGSFQSIEGEISSIFYNTPKIVYSGGTSPSKAKFIAGIVHNSHLRVDAKIACADNKLPFTPKFKKEAIMAFKLCVKDTIVNSLRDSTAVTFHENTEEEIEAYVDLIANRIAQLIPDPTIKDPKEKDHKNPIDEQKEDYALSKSDLATIDELRVLIQNEPHTEQTYQAAYPVLSLLTSNRDIFKDKLVDAIDDTFVFDNVFAINILLANEYVQKAMISVLLFDSKPNLLEALEMNLQQLADRKIKITTQVISSGMTMNLKARLNSYRTIMDKWTETNRLKKELNDVAKAFDFLACIVDDDLWKAIFTHDATLRRIDAVKASPDVGSHQRNSDLKYVINSAYDEVWGLYNLQILKLLCRRYSVYFAQTDNDKKLYLFPYPWDPNLAANFPGSVCVSDKGTPSPTKIYWYNERRSIWENACVATKKGLFRQSKLQIKGKFYPHDAVWDPGYKGNPWDPVHDLVSFSNYVWVRMDIFDKKHTYLSKRTDDVINLDIPDETRKDMFLSVFQKTFPYKQERTFQINPNYKILNDLP